MCFAVVGCVLGFATVSSVRTGPSAGGALVAIRVAQQELLLAKPALRYPLNEAESLLIQARSTLKERRYEESILAARKAYQKLVDRNE
jgi:hypothetical protein